MIRFNGPLEELEFWAPWFSMFKHHPFFDAEKETVFLACYGIYLMDDAGRVSEDTINFELSQLNVDAGVLFVKHMAGDEWDRWACNLVGLLIHQALSSAMRGNALLERIQHKRRHSIEPKDLVRLHWLAKNLLTFLHEVSIIEGMDIVEHVRENVDRYIHESHRIRLPEEGWTSEDIKNFTASRLKTI